MKAAASIQNAVAEAQADLDSLRDRVRDLMDEREAVASACVDRAEAERRVRAMVEGARQRNLLAMPELFAAEQAQVSPYLGRRLSDDVFSTLASVVPDQLAEALLRHHEGDGGLSVDSRLAKLHELDAALFAAEIAEEVCCRELERAVGTAVPRRLDADCAILLAPSSELEPPDPDETTPAAAGSTKRRTSSK